MQIQRGFRARLLDLAAKKARADTNKMLESYFICKLT
jgi:hypothetical protein